MRLYTAPDGKQYPVTEAGWSIAFLAHRSDLRRAKQGDPTRCILALGIKRDRHVLEAYVGAGRDAYIVFRANGKTPARAVHFTIRTRAKRIIDTFDKDKNAETETVWLDRPAESWKLAYRRKSNARRRKEIKKGAAVKKRSKPINTRDRRGLINRPRPAISFATQEAAAAA